MDLPFAGFACAEFIEKLSQDIIPPYMRQEQKRLDVPSLSVIGCRILSICARLSKPTHIVDVGCGIGISSMALHLGAPSAAVSALDANRERADICRRLTADTGRITVYSATAEAFLNSTEERYDMAFVDSIKKDYPAVWHLLRKKLNPGATIVFDDVLLYGYTAETDATVPLKYREGVRQLRTFLEEMTQEFPCSQILPVSGGMLLITL